MFKCARIPQTRQGRPPAGKEERKMRGVLLRWVALTAAVLAASWLLDGIRVDGFLPALLAAGLLGIMNAFFRPILIVLTLPVNILTLGLFTFLINALLLKIVSEAVPGFEVRGFWTAVIGALIIGLASWLLNLFIGGRGRVERTSTIDLQKRGGRWE
jgi:putative membrane protein